MLSAPKRNIQDIPATLKIGVWASCAAREPLAMLACMTIAMHLAHASWMVLITNFAAERGNFDGEYMGYLHAVREIPGFLAFTVVFILLLIREYSIALVSLLVLGIGGALTGYFPQTLGIFFFTFVTSIGFHLYQTVYQSLSLQWLPREQAPAMLGKILAAGAGAQLVAYGGAFIGHHFFAFDFEMLFLISGCASLLVIALVFSWFPDYRTPHMQHSKLLIRHEYWLYYILTFFSGARRQIFVVFAVFLLVEKFHFTVADVALLYLINCVITSSIGSAVGRAISRFGERRALIFEYVGLTLVFIAYALVEDKTVAAALYLIDNVLFALAIALNTYLQKIGRPEDMASTAAVSFSLNHVAAVGLPPVMGILWLTNPALVFWLAAALAFCSLLASLLVPRHPARGNETTITNMHVHSQL